MKRRKNPSQPGETPEEDVANALQILAGALGADSKSKVTLTRAEFQDIHGRLHSALRKLRTGKNPGVSMLALVNPPRIMASCVYAIEYKHQDDGQNYRHDFERWDDVQMCLIPGDDTKVLILGKGIPIVDMFPAPGD